MTQISAKPLDQLFAEIGPDIPRPDWMDLLHHDLDHRLALSTAVQRAAVGDRAVIRAFWMTLGPFVRRFPYYCYDAMNQFCALPPRSPVLTRAIDAVELLRDDETQEEESHWKLFVQAGASVAVQYYEMNRDRERRDLDHDDMLPEVRRLLHHFEHPDSLVHACLNFFATEMVANAVCQVLHTPAFHAVHGKPVEWVRVHLNGLAHHPERTWEHEDLAYRMAVLCWQAGEGPEPTHAFMRQEVLGVAELFYQLGEAGLAAYA